MKITQSRWWMRWMRLGTVLGLALGLLLYSLHVFPVLSPVMPLVHLDSSRAPRTSRPSVLFDNLSLSEEQCEAAFPGLTKDIHSNVALGPFELSPSGDMGPLQAMVKGGNLFILHAERPDVMAPELLDSRTAALHQIHRAIITSPEPLPDTIFTVNVQDQPFGAAWSYSRPAYPAPGPSGPPITRAFLMPHFSFWAWPTPFVGSFSRASAAIEALERRLPFPRKDPRAVWRGTADYNGIHNPHLRQDLLRVAEHTSWADVQRLKHAAAPAATNLSASSSGPGVGFNGLMIEDFCRYKYIIHTEGITYSGRFQLHQMCRSVVITPPIAWLQHLTHLVKPLFSDDLDLHPGSFAAGTRRRRPPSPPTKEVGQAWPTHHEPGAANIVFVSPDWSDLEATVRWLEDHPAVAEGIATRQRELFVGGGYFSPAAEACYWRALIRGWSKVARNGAVDSVETWPVGQGHVSWETFALRRAV